MKRTWWVAFLFVLPSLALTLLLNSALFLERGMSAPIVWIGILSFPFVAKDASVKHAFARGLAVLAFLALVFVSVVYLRIWTEAGKAVLEREGLLTSSHWALALVVVAGLGAFLLARGGHAPRPETVS